MKSQRPRHWSMRIGLLILQLGTVAVAAQPDSPPPDLYVGLRRSEYGLKKLNTDHTWWAQRTREYAIRFPGSHPTIVEIVSTYQDDGTTQFGFARPKEAAERLEHMAFAGGSLDHEQALTEYDRQGVSVILQLESGNADMLQCLSIVHRQFGKHPCVLGFGVDAEWYFCKGSARNAGRPISDDEAKAWMQQALSLNPKYTLFLKHWDEKHMPPNYRHPQLLFISDSQQFKSAGEWEKDLTNWGRHFEQSVTGYQFGYKADQKWWSKLSNPPAEMGERLRKALPNCRYLFWVDFTADKVEF